MWRNSKKQNNPQLDCITNQDLSQRIIHASNSTSFISLEVLLCRVRVPCYGSSKDEMFGRSKEKSFFPHILLRLAQQNELLCNCSQVSEFTLGFLSKFATVQTIVVMNRPMIGIGAVIIQECCSILSGFNLCHSIFLPRFFNCIWVHSSLTVCIHCEKYPILQPCLAEYKPWGASQPAVLQSISPDGPHNPPESVEHYSVLHFLLIYSCDVLWRWKHYKCSFPAQ